MKHLPSANVAKHTLRLLKTLDYYKKADYNKKRGDFDGKGTM